MVVPAATGVQAALLSLLLYHQAADQLDRLSAADVAVTSDAAGLGVVKLTLPFSSTALQPLSSYTV